jgi:hypothetical protein
MYRVSCIPLASTGSSLAAHLGLGGVLLLAGVTLVLLTRARHSRTAVTVVLLLVIGGGLTAGLTGSTAARAATSDCAPGTIPTSGVPSPAVEDSLRIVQTSTMTGLAPGVAPVAITGTITNISPDSTLVTAVTVSIAAVTAAAAAAAGTCDASDYVLLAVDMPVGQTLAPGESANFAGARIGFNDKSVNQDACKSALVSLSYVRS